MDTSVTIGATLKTVSSNGVESMNLGFKSKLIRGPFEQSIRTKNTSAVVKTYGEFYIESWVDKCVNVHLSMFRLFLCPCIQPDYVHFLVMSKWSCNLP